MRSTEMIANNELVQGKDYFVFADGRYFTIGALMKVYDCSDSNITQKVAKFSVAKQKIFDRWVYKDDIRFEKGKSSGNGFKKGDPRIAKILSHNEMVILVQKMDKDINEMKSMLTDILDHLTRYKTVEEVLGRTAINNELNKKENSSLAN